MHVSIHAEVGAGCDVAHFQEVQALDTDRNHALLITVNELELIEALSLLVDFDPGVVANVAKDLIFGL